MCTSLLSQSPCSKIWPMRLVAYGTFIMEIIFHFENTVCNVYLFLTPSNYRICARRRVPAKHFNFSHLYVDIKEKYARNKKWKKQLKAFISVYWSSLEIFIEAQNPEIVSSVYDTGKIENHGITTKHANHKHKRGFVILYKNSIYQNHLSFKVNYSIQSV